MDKKLKDLGVDAWGDPKSPYTFRGVTRGWSCNYCGGMFRGLKSLQEHQQRKHTVEEIR